MARKSRKRESEKIDIASKLIKKRKAPAKSSIDDEAVATKSVLSYKDGKYSITPRGILICMLGDLCPDFGKNDPDWFTKFTDAERRLIENFSLLSSGGKDSKLFGDSINDMFSVCIRCINLGAKYRKALEDMGVDPDDIADRNDEELL